MPSRPDADIGQAAGADSGRRGGEAQAKATVTESHEPFVLVRAARVRAAPVIGVDATTRVRHFAAGGVIVDRGLSRGARLHMQEDWT